MRPLEASWAEVAERLAAARSYWLGTSDVLMLVILRLTCRIGL